MSSSLAIKASANIKFVATPSSTVAITLPTNTALDELKEIVQLAMNNNPVFYQKSTLMMSNSVKNY